AAMELRAIRREVDGRAVHRTWTTLARPAPAVTRPPAEARTSSARSRRLSSVFDTPPSARLPCATPHVEASKPSIQDVPMSKKWIARLSGLALVVVAGGVLNTAVNATAAACPNIVRPVICSNGKIYVNQCYANLDHAKNCVPYE